MILKNKILKTSLLLVLVAFIFTMFFITTTGKENSKYADLTDIIRIK